MIRIIKRIRSGGQSGVDRAALDIARRYGADTPQELIDHASALGIKVLAVTDHDIRPPKWRRIFAMYGTDAIWQTDRTTRSGLISKDA